MAFEKGNTLASKGGLWRSTLDRAIKQEDGKRLRKAAEKLLDCAAAGEPWAVKELADRLDGKPGQAVTIAGDSENPLVQEIAIRLVDAAGSTDTEGS